MSIIQIVLMLFAAVMLARQVLLFGKVNALIARYGAVRFRPSFWVHLVVTIAAIIASVVSLVGVSA